MECVVLSTDALRSSVSSERTSRRVSTPLLDRSEQGARDVVARRPLLLDQCASSGPRDVAPHHPAEHRGRDPVRDVGHELAATIPRHAGDQLIDEGGRLRTQCLDAARGEPRHHHATQFLVVGAFGAEEGAANHLEPAGPEVGIHEERVARRAGEQTDARRRTDDRRLLASGAQTGVRFAGERVRTGRSRNGRSRNGSEPAGAVTGAAYRDGVRVRREHTRR